MVIIDIIINVNAPKPTVNLANCFAKNLLSVEQSYNCKRHTAGRQQNIAYSQCYYEHAGKRTEPVVSVHGVKSEKIAEEGRNIDNSKQNCFDPSKGDTQSLQQAREKAIQS